MKHLSSCYFCGAAVETEVREYPVVTGSLEDLDLPPVEDRPTVMLCSNCRHKLDRLLEAGLGSRETHGRLGAPSGGGPPGARSDAGGSAGRTAGADGNDDRTADAGRGDGRASDPADPDPAPATGGGSADAAGGDETTGGPGERRREDDRSSSESGASRSSEAGAESRSGSDSKTGDDADPASKTGGSDGDSEESEVSIPTDAEIFEGADPVPVADPDDGDDAPRSAGESTPTDRSSGESDRGNPTGATGEGGDRSRPAGADDDGTAGESGGDSPGEPDRSYTASQAAGGRPTSSHGSTDGGRDTPSGDDEDEDGAGDEDDDVPTEAYNKVVRLLQNRDFPVEREDILTVATNAYGLARGDCEAAIESLVDRGVIEVEGGQIREGD